MTDNDFALRQGKRPTLAACAAGAWPDAFVEPVAPDGKLPDMPLFFRPEIYVPVPLAATYLAAWETVPAFWCGVLERQRHSGT